MAKPLRLALLGGLQVTQGDAPVTGFVSSKALALLCYLAATGRPHLRPALAGLLWGEMPDASANTNLRKALSNLRQLVGDHLIFAQQSVAFDRDSAHWLDSEAFGQQVEAALGRGEDLPSSETAAGLAQAFDLYRGDFLAGFYVRDAPDFEEWVLTERERLRELARRALHALAGHHAARGENIPALDYATRLLALDPWREEVHRQVMRLLARSGQRSAALAQYETCRRLLADELGVEPMAETTALYERIRAASARRLHLPAQPTPFVGREDELARLTRCFDRPDCRLLTLVGPGGIGKTRLALQMAEARQEAFLDGVYLVPLAGVDSAELLVPAIAEALHFAFYGRQDSKAQLLAYLHEKELLLLLDNFEHLVTGAGLLAEILEQAPQVKLLVTSRQRLDLRWEWLFDVGGLPYPAADEAGRLAEFSAVQLFAQTASRVRPDFSLADQGPSVARICRLVEGLPLALELAAAGLRARPCAEIAAELAHNLDLLATTQRDVPERHRSVRAAFEGSWQRLSGEEQRALRQLSVFRGGFEREVARQVAGATRSTLEALAIQSLLQDGGGARYQMHELLRQFAAEKLAEWPQEQAEAHARHGDYYTTFVQRRQEALRGAEQPRALAELGSEIENVRAAWSWAGTGRQAGTLDRALEGVYRFFNLRGRLAEGHELLARAAAALAGNEGLLGRLLARQAWFTFRLGQYQEARAQAEQSLVLLRPLGKPEEEALAHLTLGVVTDEMGEYDPARAHLEASLALYEQAGDRWGLARALDHLGGLARMIGEYEQAEAYYARCLALCQETGDRAGLADAYNSLGSAAGTRGDYAQARTYFEQSLALCRELDDRFGIAGASHNLGNIAFLQGNLAEAKRLRQETLSICHEIGFRWGVADSLRHLGNVCRRLGEYAEARRCYQESLVLKREIGHKRGIALTLADLGALAQSMGEYGEARTHYGQALRVALELESPPVILAILSSWGELLALEGQRQQALALLDYICHHPAAEQQIQDQIAGLLAELRAGLPPETVAAAQAQGHTWTLESVADEILGCPPGRSLAD
jgi:predicted ATPase/DNA-binding SARP family transcriptional activator/uncharacterized protein HemY